VVDVEDFVRAKVWREMGTDDILKSIETATGVLKDHLKGEALDEPSELGRVLQLLDLSAVFQEMAMGILAGLAEKSGE
jgi:hypothetical protein